MDYHATTPVDARVVEAMLPYFTERFGNAASKGHRYGEAAEEAVEAAREALAAAIGAVDAREIVFTSGATESNNLALQGAMDFYRTRGNHLVVSAIEHKAVLDTARALEARGARLTIIPVDREGLVDLAALAAAVTEETVVVSIMHANNEIGTLQPLHAIAAIAHERGALFHTDATQSVGKVPVDVEAAEVDLLSFSAHKLYGPKGVGALYVRRSGPRVRLTPLIWGGGHERGMRSGTLNVPGIVGFGAAAGLCAPQESARVAALRDRLEAALLARIDAIHVNGSRVHRLPGNLNVAFECVEGESLQLALERDVAVSTGSACTSATLAPSHVLRAIGLSDDVANASLRFGLGRFNTEAEVDFVADRVVAEVERLRGLSPLYSLRTRSL